MGCFPCIKKKKTIGTEKKGKRRKEKREEGRGKEMGRKSRRRGLREGEGREVGKGYDVFLVLLEPVYLL
jgi:hypothetical protein